MTYNPGQFRSILPFVAEPPTALVLAGPADGNEAQIAVELWPSLLVVGIEPDWSGTNSIGGSREF